MNKEQFAIYEKTPQHGKDYNGVILAPFNTKEEAEIAGKKYGYYGDNYYVDILDYNKIEEPNSNESSEDFHAHPKGPIDQRTSEIKNWFDEWCSLYKKEGKEDFWIETPFGMLKNPEFIQKQSDENSNEITMTIKYDKWEL